MYYVVQMLLITGGIQQLVRGPIFTSHPARVDKHIKYVGKFAHILSFQWPFIFSSKQ